MRAELRRVEQELTRRPSRPEPYIEAGILHSKLGELSAATGEFREALKLDPRNLRAALLFSIAELQQQHADVAVPYLLRVQAAAPHNEVVLAGLGQAYALLRRFEDAQRWYRRLNQENPNNADGWYGLGVTYLSIQRDSARVLLETAAHSRYGLAFVADHLLFQGEVRGATTLYAELAGKDPTMLCPHARLGFAKLRNGANEEANAEFAAEFSRHRQCPLARLGVAASALRAGQVASSLAELTAIEEHDAGYLRSHLDWIWLAIPDNERARTLASLAYRTEPVAQRLREAAAGSSFDVGQLAGSSGRGAGGLTAQQLKAESSYAACASVLAVAPARTAAQQQLLAECAYESGHYEEAFSASARVANGTSSREAGLYWRALSAERLAVEALRHAAMINPESEKVHLLLAEARREHDDLTGAESEYREAIQVRPKNIQSHLALAALLCHEQRKDEALVELDQVLAMRPDDPEASYLKATILVERGAHRESLPLLRNALQASTTLRPRVHGLLGSVYAELGEPAAAIAELKAAAPDDVDGRYHYQLYRLYKSIGDTKAAAAALEESLRRHAKAERGESVPMEYRTELGSPL